MEGILDRGIQVILWLQHASPSLDLVFRSITILGDEIFFLLFLPFVYWCVNRNFGIRLSILFLLSSYANSMAKLLVEQPRPFQYSSEVKQLVEAGGGGLPSFHTQSAVIIWGYVAYIVRKPWTWVIAVLLMLLIPLSRVYLGVHFPSDIFGGYILGACFLLLFISLEQKIGLFIINLALKWQITLAIGIPLLLLFLLPGPDKTGIASMGTLAGVGSGFILENKYIGFLPSVSWWKRILSFLIGIVILFIFWAGLKLAFASLGLEPFFRFVRYGIMGLWVGFGGPWLFKKLHLSE